MFQTDTIKKWLQTHTAKLLQNCDDCAQFQKLRLHQTAYQLQSTCTATITKYNFGKLNQPSHLNKP